MYSGSYMSPNTVRPPHATIPQQTSTQQPQSWWSDTLCVLLCKCYINYILSDDIEQCVRRVATCWLVGGAAGAREMWVQGLERKYLPASARYVTTVLVRVRSKSKLHNWKQGNDMLSVRRGINTVTAILCPRVQPHTWKCIRHCNFMEALQFDLMIVFPSNQQRCNHAIGKKLSTAAFFLAGLLVSSFFFFQRKVTKNTFTV